MTYDEIHIGGAKAIGSSGLEFNEDDNPTNLSQAFDIDINNDKIEPLSIEDIMHVTKQFKLWLKTNGVKDDDLQRVFKV